MATELTSQEKLFLNRVAAKMASGIGLEEAGRAVLADDRRIYETYRRANSYDRGHISHALARQVFASIHTQLANS